MRETDRDRDKVRETETEITWERQIETEIK